jgi:hypothetical protein
VKRNNGLYVFVDSMDRGLSIESKYILLSFKVSVHDFCSHVQGSVHALSTALFQQLFFLDRAWREYRLVMDRA